MDVSYIPGARQLLDSFINGGKESRPMIEVFFDWLEGKDLSWGEKLKLWPYMSAWAVIKKIVGIDSDGVKDIISRKRELVNAAKNVINSVLEHGLLNPIVLNAPLVVYFEIPSTKQDFSVEKKVMSEMWDDGVCMIDFMCRGPGDKEVELFTYAQELGFSINLTIDIHDVNMSALGSVFEYGIRNVTLDIAECDFDRVLLQKMFDAIGKRYNIRLYISGGEIDTIEEKLNWLFEDVSVVSVELFSENKNNFSDEDLKAISKLYESFTNAGYYLIADSVLPFKFFGGSAEINTRLVRLKGTAGRKIWEYIGYTGEGRIWGYVDRKMRLFPSFRGILPLADLTRNRISDVWYNYNMARSKFVENMEIALPTNPGSRFAFDGKEESPSSAGQGAG